ncbi:MAG: AAA family ATPase [Egibacteraceae bacterium]
MKLGVVGKGGVGKTTLAALLAQAYTARGLRVVAIDTDSNPNLGLSLGLDLSATEAVPVLPRSLIVGNGGGVTARAVLAEYGVDTPAGATLLSAIRVTEAGAGCTCGGHATVRSLLGDVLSTHADVALVDMEAGLEHLSRSGGTLAYADVLLVVMEPSRKSVVLAARTKALASQLGIPRVYGLGNKARDQGDEDYLTAAAAEHDLPLAGVLSYEPELAALERSATAVVTAPRESVRAAVDRVVDFLEGVSVR